VDAAGGDGLIDNPWMPPHLSHRFRTDVDIGMKDFPREFRKALEKVIRNVGFGFPVLIESPADPESSHWHLRK